MSNNDYVKPHYYSGDEVLLISRYYFEDVVEQYEGQHITFSIDPDHSWWATDSGLPLGPPIIGDIHIFDGEKFIDYLNNG